MTLPELLKRHPELRARYRTHWHSTIAYLKREGISDAEIATLAEPVSPEMTVALCGGIRPAARALLLNKNVLHRRVNEGVAQTFRSYRRMTKEQSAEMIAAAHEQSVLLREQNSILERIAIALEKHNDPRREDGGTR